ncbi:MAG: peptidoglycan DD-metalloendopeptidase family protein [Thermoanaerobaculia bacterium]
MQAGSRGKLLKNLGFALPVAAAAILAPLALTSWLPDAPVSKSAVAADLTQSSTTVPHAKTAAVPPPDRILTLKAGDTLGAALRDLGLDGAEAERAASAAARYLNPRQLRPGLRIAAFMNGVEPARFAVAVSGQGELSVERGGQDWLPSWRPYRRETRTHAIHGIVSGSLEGAVVAAGGDSDLTYAMADALQWDLDFNRDLQPGDRFEVLFEETYVEGRSFGIGRVLALTYAQSRRTLETYRFGDAGAFYDSEGHASERMFLRAPLAYSRVTSKFTSRRFHPLLKIFRPHYGVDYGAPVGTPVRVTASGTVLQAGWDGGGGNAIKVRHLNGYVTSYLHLSRFASGIHAGARVSQSDVIGFVGATGLATGPHLDYRVQRDGEWIDPQALQSVPAPALDRAQRLEFLAARDAMRAALEVPSGGPHAGSAPLATAAMAAVGKAASIARQPISPVEPATAKRK